MGRDEGSHQGGEEIGIAEKEEDGDKDIFIIL